MSQKLIEGPLQQLSEGVSFFALCLADTVPDKAHLPFNVSSVMVEANTESIIESHQSREVWAIVQGEGTVHSQGQDYPCKPGDVFFFDSFANHKVKNHSDHCMVLTSMWWPID